MGLREVSVWKWSGISFVGSLSWCMLGSVGYTQNFDCQYFYPAPFLIKKKILLDIETNIYSIYIWVHTREEYLNPL